MRELIQKISKNILNYQLIKPNQKLIICVSGGADSVALLETLIVLRFRWNYELSILHFHHGIRNSSDAESVFVQSLAEKHDLPFFIRCSTEWNGLTPGIQEKARHWRREEAQSLMGELGATGILTAHHGDDQMETLLLKWLRGCHLSHFQGMLWKQPPYIRPLLNCSKLELQWFLQQQQQEWMEDVSNQSPKYLRNRVRHELIPLMQELSRGGLQQRLEDWSLQSQHFDQCTQQILGMDPVSSALEQPELSVRWLFSQGEGVIPLMLYQWLTHQIRSTVDFKQIERTLHTLDQKTVHWKLDFPKGWQLLRNRDILSMNQR